MVSRIVLGRALGALTGAAMLAALSGPSAAFTLSAPSPTHAIAAADSQPVYWGGWGWRRPWGWHRPWAWRHHWWGWRRPFYYGSVGPRCWVSPWGRVHCGWWG
jgi:hypothetical protein